MSHPVRTARQPNAPGHVYAVLRQPGKPLVAHAPDSLTAQSSRSARGPASASGAQIRTADPGSSAEADAERLGGAVTRGEGLPRDVGFDFSRIRIHDDARAAASARAVGARAYTVGRDIVFGAGEFQPSTSRGRHLLAHELAHAARSISDPVPTLHRYEAPEHQDFGDRGLEDLAAFLLTDKGKEFSDAIGNTAPAKEIQLDPFFKGKKFKVQGVELSVGDILAMAGDFYGSVADLMRADPAELKEIRDAIQEEREGKLKGGKANERYQAITLKYISSGKRAKEKSFLGLAKVNAPHFTPTNRAAWKELHKEALKAARAAGKDPEKLETALLTDAFGGHFLTDAFASGHLFDKTKLEVEIQKWVSNNKVAPPNPEMSTYYGIIGSDMPLVILKSIHDRLNAEGIEVSNARGFKWKTFGDDHLKSAPDSLRVGALAVYESRRQVMTASRGPAAEAAPNDDALSDQILELLPDQASIDRATAKAVSYIPEAANTVTSLIYRQRGAGALELKQRMGPVGSVVAPIIKANIETIADPHREKDLLRLEEESRRKNTGPLLAPQFTVWTFGK